VTGAERLYVVQGWRALWAHFEFSRIKD